MGDYLHESGGDTAGQAVAATYRRPATEQEHGLLAAMSRGDADAFWDLWSIHRDHLYSVCVRVLGGNHAEAEDALAEVMMKARTEMSRRAQEIAVPRAWLTRMARNLCIDLQRGLARQAKVTRQLEGWSDRADCGGAMDAQTSAMAFVAEESAAEIRCRLNRLPPELREPFEMRFFEEKSCAEIAARLSLSSAGVRKRLQLARLSLKRSWDEGLADESGRRVPGNSVPIPPSPLVARPVPREIVAPTAVMRVAPVLLPCGVVRYFRIFLAREPARERQKIASSRAYLLRHPGSRTRPQELAQLLYQTGAWMQVVRVCRQTLEQKPFWLRGALLLGEVLFLMGRRDEAAAVYTQGLLHARCTASRKHLSGLIAGCREDWEEAARHFTDASGEEPDNAVHWHALAWAQLQAGRPEAALRALDAALGLDRGDLVALSAACAALLAVERGADAWPRLQQALIEAPAEPLVWVRLAESNGAMASPKSDSSAQRKRLLRYALQQAPNSPTVQAVLADYHLARGEHDRGLTLMRALHTRHPGCARITQQYRRVLALTGAQPAREPGSQDKPCLCTGACRLAGIRAGF